MKAIPIVALDVATAVEATRLVDGLSGLCDFYKVGSELYTAQGPDVLRMLHERGASVFLDLKFHDIPNTVRGAVKSAAQPGVRLLTIHASGGREMMAAASAAASAAGIQVFAVTILTSLDAAALSEAWGRPAEAMEAEVLRLAGLARDAGVHGVVCSGQEAGAIRQRLPRLATLVPGVRLPGADHGDQSRVVTPRQAADAGASYIVLGRTVTSAPSPRDAMERVLADLS